MSQRYKRKPRRAQERELPLFRWAATQDRKLTYAERRLRRDYGMSVHRARLTAELAGLGGLHDG